MLGKIKNPHWRKAWRWGLFSFSSQTLGNFLLPVQSKRNKLRECVKWWIVVLVSQKVKMRRLCSHLCLCSVLVYFLSLHFIVHLPETDFFFFLKRVLCSHQCLQNEPLIGFANLLFWKYFLDFPGSPVVKTPCFHFKGTGSIPGWGTKILHATWHSHKKENKQTNKQKTTKFLHWTVLIILFY